MNRRTAPRRFEIVCEALADCRFALRACRNDWRLASVVCLILALGTGSAAAVFSMVDQLLLQPPPGVGSSEGVAYLQFQTPDQTAGSLGEGISTVVFDELRRTATSLSGVASYGSPQMAVSVGTGYPIEAAGNTIYGDFFELLGVRPSAGRLLHAHETELGEDPSRIVISESLRDRLFGSAPAVGRPVYLDGVPFTVIGVTAGGFAGPEKGEVSEFWIPIGALSLLYGYDAAGLADPATRLHRTNIVRVRPGVSTSQAVTQLTAIVHRLARGTSASAPYLDSLRPVLFAGLETPPLIRGHLHRTLRLVGVVAALVLLIVCANVSSLLLVRILKRRSTTAMLLAMGASGVRIARQQVAYSILLGLAGATVGIPVAWAIYVLLGRGAFFAMPHVSGLHFDRNLILFVPVAGVLAGMLCGVAPAALATRFDLSSALRAGIVTQSGRRRTLRIAFSAAQLAMSLALTVGALLLLHGIHELFAVDTGMDADGVLALSLHRSPLLSPAESDALFRRVVSSASSLPNVEGAALDPYGFAEDGYVADIGLVGEPKARVADARMVPVTPGLLRVLHVPVVSGRVFHEGDWSYDRPGGVVLTASLARRLFGHTDVAGREVALSPSKTEIVVGVVGDIRSPDSREPRDAFFVTFGDIAQRPLQYFTLLVRGRHFDQQAVQSIRSAVQGAIPDEAVPEVRLLSDDLGKLYAEPIMLARLLGALALIGIVVATIGAYAVIATTVEDGRHEFAIRLALGATPVAIGRMVATQTVAIITAGTLFGLWGAYAIARLLRGELYGVGAIDPLSYIAAVALLIIVIAAATAGPVRRAMRVDPMRSLRSG